MVMEVKEENNMKRLFILLIKYMPIIQMISMLFNNTLYYTDNYNTCYLLDFAFGNSILTTILLFVCSYTFNFCNWYRIIITTNLINIFIANADAYYILSMTDIQLLTMYYIISGIGCIISICSYIYGNKNTI